MSNLMRQGSGAVCGCNEHSPCVVECFETRLKSFVHIAHDLTSIGGLKKQLFYQDFTEKWNVLDGSNLFRISLN